MAAMACWVACPVAVNRIAVVALILLSALFAGAAFSFTREAMVAFHHDSWCLKISDEGVLIQIRAFRRRGQPSNDKAVVFIESSEIAAVGKYVDTRTTAPIVNDTTNVDTETFLEMQARPLSNERTASRHSPRADRGDAGCASLVIRPRCPPRAFPRSA